MAWQELNFGDFPTMNLFFSLFSRRILSISYGIYAVVMTSSYAGLLLAAILIPAFPRLVHEISDMNGTGQKTIGSVSLGYKHELGKVPGFQFLKVKVNKIVLRSLF